MGEGCDAGHPSRADGKGNEMTEQPFAAAIEHLQRLVKLYPEGFSWGEECKSAIRVLEAAGVIGRKRLVELVDITRQQDDTTLEYLFRAILAALPDATPEKKGELK